MNGCAIEISSYLPSGSRQYAKTSAKVDSTLDCESRSLAPALLSTPAFPRLRVPQRPKRASLFPSLLITNLTDNPNHCQPNGQSKHDRVSRFVVSCLIAGSAVALASGVRCSTSWPSKLWHAR